MSTDTEFAGAGTQQPTETTPETIEGRYPGLFFLKSLPGIQDVVHKQRPDGGISMEARDTDWNFRYLLHPPTQQDYQGDDAEFQRAQDDASLLLKKLHVTNRRNGREENVLTGPSGIFVVEIDTKTMSPERIQAYLTKIKDLSPMERELALGSFFLRESTFVSPKFRTISMPLPFGLTGLYALGHEMKHFADEENQIEREALATRIEGMASRGLYPQQEVPRARMLLQLNEEETVGNAAVSWMTDIAHRLGATEEQIQRVKDLAAFGLFTYREQWRDQAPTIDSAAPFNISPSQQEMFKNIYEKAY